MKKTDYLKSINILENIIFKDNIEITSDIKSALQDAINAINSLRRRNDVVMDFQGWPMESCTAQDLHDKFITLENEPIDYKVRVLEDDGMGYGAHNGFCNGIEIDEKEKNINIWF